MRILIKDENKATTVLECSLLEYCNDLFGCENVSEQKYGCRFLASDNVVLGVIIGVNKKTCSSIQRELLEKGYADLTSYGESILMPSPFSLDDLMDYDDYDFSEGEEEKDLESEGYNSKADYEEIMQLIKDPRYKGYFED